MQLRKQFLLSVLVFFAISVFFTWPSVLFDNQVLITRHFDLYPTIWLLEKAPGTFPGMFHGDSAWPFGESLARVDSYLLLILGWINNGLLPGWLIANLMLLFGPVLNALAAQHSAKVFGATQSASFFAGIVYGFSGIASSAVLEGHYYHLLIPWLPLLLAKMASKSENNIRSGLIVGVFWVLSLFTTAYFGVLASLVLVVGIFIDFKARLRQWSALLLIIPASGYYMFLFSQGGRWADVDKRPDLILAMGSQTLGSFTTFTEALDLGAHSISAPIGFTVLWLALLAPVIIRDSKRIIWILLISGLFCILISFGRFFRLDIHTDPVWSPVALLVGIPGMEFFRFPIRFAWLVSLFLGILGSLTITSLIKGLTKQWMVSILYIFLLGDVFLLAGLPLRSRSAIGAVPSAYQAAPENKPILDIFGQGIDRSSGELEMWSRNLGCYYQTNHKRPILELCIGAGVQSPREILDDWLGKQVLDGNGGLVKKQLCELGIGSIALHRNYYRDSDGMLLSESLQDIFGNPVISDDGGEVLELYSMMECENSIDPKVFIRQLL